MYAECSRSLCAGHGCHVSFLKKSLRSGTLGSVANADWLLEILIKIPLDGIQILALVFIHTHTYIRETRNGFSGHSVPALLI